jgi:DNA modification methylase
MKRLLCGIVTGEEGRPQAGVPNNVEVGTMKAVKTAAKATGLRLERLPLEKLIPAEWNPSTITDEQLRILAKNIDEWGFVEPIVWNRRTGRVVGGHQRLKVLLARRFTETEVVAVDLSEKREKALNIALNKTGGGFDLPALAGILAELDSAGVDTELAGFPEAELEQLLSQLAPDRELLTDPDQVIEPPEHPVTETGDVWLLGEHRLLCGDATRTGDVARLLEGASPVLMATDPPYGVSVDHTWRKGLRPGKARSGRLEGDDTYDWSEAWKHVPPSVVAAYVWHSALHAGETQAALAAAGFEVRQQIIWNKAVHTLGRSAYQWKHEPCWYAVRKGRSAPWLAGRDQTTVWEAASPLMPFGRSGSEPATAHPTQKPVELFLRPIRNHLVRGEAVFDPFVGSGTSIIAAEQLGRRCYAMDIDPRYVDVAVFRWEAATGGKARTVSGKVMNRG